jgi:hypothetical protein
MHCLQGMRASAFSCARILIVFRLPRLLRGESVWVVGERFDRNPNRNAHPTHARTRLHVYLKPLTPEIFVQAHEDAPGGFWQSRGVGALPASLHRVLDKSRAPGPRLAGAGTPLDRLRGRYIICPPGHRRASARSRRRPRGAARARVHDQNRRRRTLGLFHNCGIENLPQTTRCFQTSEPFSKIRR